MSDAAILAELGQRLARHRLNANITQAVVAREAGVARRTLSRAENGQPIDSQNLVRILRALGLLDGLNALLPAERPSPVAMAQQQGAVRERARGKPPAGDQSPDWRWPDEEEP